MIEGTSKLIVQINLDVLITEPLIQSSVTGTSIKLSKNWREEQLRGNSSSPYIIAHGNRNANQRRCGAAANTQRGINQTAEAQTEAHTQTEKGNLGSCGLTAPEKTRTKTATARRSSEGRTQQHCLENPRAHKSAANSVRSWGTATHKRNTLADRLRRWLECRVPPKWVPRPLTSRGLGNPLRGGEETKRPL